MSSVSAILLAAGSSSRMGQVNKLSLSINGMPLVERTARTLLDAQLGEIVVVVGHEKESVRNTLSGLPLQIVSNQRFKEGQMTSVYCGLEALKEPCQGVMVCLSDLPLLEAADINKLVQTYLSDPSISVLVPTYRGHRGNPIILSYQHRKEILNGKRNLGCKHLIDKNPDLVTTIEMENDHVVFDLDTPEDLKRLQKRLEQNSVKGVKRDTLLSVKGS